MLALHKQYQVYACAVPAFFPVDAVWFRYDARQRFVRTEGYWKEMQEQCRPQKAMKLQKEKIHISGVSG